MQMAKNGQEGPLTRLSLMGNDAPAVTPKPYVPATGEKPEERRQRGGGVFRSQSSNPQDTSKEAL